MFTYKKTHNCKNVSSSNWWLVWMKFQIRNWINQLKNLPGRPKSQTSQDTLERKDEKKNPTVVRGLAMLGIMIYTPRKKRCDISRNRQVDQCNRIEIWQTDLYIYGNLITEASLQISREKVGRSIHGARITRYLYRKKKQNLYFITYKNKFQLN